MRKCHALAKRERVFFVFYFDLNEVFWTWYLPIIKLS
jgi:hypothetical protein